MGDRLLNSVKSGSLLLRACRGEQVERAPVWLLRQAGRYLPEYRALRQRSSFFELCKTPEKAAEISLLPYRIFGVDAVIIFSDILVPVEAMGARVHLAESGPELPEPVREQSQVAALEVFDPVARTHFVLETIQRLRALLRDAVPVIGFAGGPWTLACYLIEGKTSKDFSLIKQMMATQPELLRALLDKLAESTRHYLQAQIDAGAQVVQLFETWAGELDRAGFYEFVLPYLQTIIAGLKSSSVPVILFVKGCSHLLESMRESGAGVLSVDWRVDLMEARRRLGPQVVLQGNVDPAVLLGPAELVRRAVEDCLAQTGGVGHILNLGHGVLPQTPVENVRLFVETAKSAAARPWASTRPLPVHEA